MKYIKNMRSFIAAVITMTLAIICFGIVTMRGVESRFVISGLIFMAWSAISFFTAFSKKEPAEQALEFSDERDRFIVLKTSNTTLKIAKHLVGAGCFINLFLYGIYKHTAFLTVGATLCGVLVTMFLIMLLANIYYEKHE